MQTFAQVPTLTLTLISFYGSKDAKWEMVNKRVWTSLEGAKDWWKTTQRGKKFRQTNWEERVSKVYSMNKLESEQGGISPRSPRKRRKSVLCQSSSLSPPSVSLSLCRWPEFVNHEWRVTLVSLSLIPTNFFTVPLPLPCYCFCPFLVLSGFCSLCRGSVRSSSIQDSAFKCLWIKSIQRTTLKDMQ